MNCILIMDIHKIVVQHFNYKDMYYISEIICDGNIQKFIRLVNEIKYITNYSNIEKFEQIQ